ncbi:TAXI family TRAP transporter solute-binding subunit [Parahaliea mediterranea]|uniref:C4-dicarboxylate ABC transporter substrate-binding protein n=1 Tax=Parahaliea mediterranea TaxID=651086 RepID=A0A939IJ95_9GAMM|nr:TAXI family TRAP transporter solute-binding subunit [Parahaliea mediterranea]MBN7797414.1 hypothetical protein [Parahaliea mediterranea]
MHALAYQHLDVAQLRGAIDNNDFDIIPVELAPGMPPLQLLTGDFADLTTVENSTPFERGVRTVIPLYQSVLHLLVRDDVSLEQLRNSGEEVGIYVVNDSHAGRTFVDLVAARTRILADNVRVLDTLVQGEPEAIVYFGPINPSTTPWYQPGYHLASLADAGPTAAEFLREGISLLVPQMQATTIPPLTYRLPGNERSLQSLQVSTLLVARKQASASQVYHLTRTLVEQKALFAALEPDIFSWVSEHFDREQLNFPLHEGARRYLERDEPGPLERYAETINLLVYLGILAATGVAGFVRWRSLRKKDRIDTFYSALLTVRERAYHEPAEDLLEELRALEVRAYGLLIEEKLAADESFRIFTELLATVRAELRR